MFGEIMIFEDRWYQIECEDAIVKDVLSNKDVHPLAAVPTGGGKTKILGSVIFKILEAHPTYDILVISHTENILRQDYESIKKFFPGIQIGLYSAGLKSRTIRKITIAGIQSIYKNPKLFSKFDMVIVDEAHTVPVEGDGMYRKFFRKNKHMQRIGLTATPFRSGHGLLYEGKGRLFNKLSYDLSSMESFNRLVDEGYLTTLISKPAELEMDITGVKTTANDFNQKALSKRFDRQTITQQAVEEVIKMGQNYKSWLIFAIDIEHADNINKELQYRGIVSDVLHSRSVTNKSRVTTAFKKGKIRALVSVGMVTTGFDAPNIDLLVLLRPTKSPVLHIQMIGRGLRIAPKKTHCLVLDFAGNIKRLGPINDVQVPVKGKKGSGDPIVKLCPQCGCIHHPTVKICDVCKFVFEFVEKIKNTYSNDQVVAKGKALSKSWVNVDKVSYTLHKKNGSPDSLKVSYKSGLRTFDEYICYGHKGYPKHVANNWVDFRWDSQLKPPNVHYLFKNSKKLSVPKKIMIDFNSKYLNIIDAEF